MDLVICPTKLSNFRDTLNDQDIEWSICQGNRDTFNEALHLGLKYEAFHNGRKKPFLGFLVKTAWSKYVYKFFKIKHAIGIYLS
jgi:hypothetical protein